MGDTGEPLKAALRDRYRLEREIGAGSAAIVYQAEDLKHHRYVAIKVLRPEHAAAVGTERFLLEIETVAKLHHPHILPLYDSGLAAGFLFFVMPYVEGESLRNRLDREKQLPIEDAFQIAREVAGALDYAHRRGVLHRDIKPENILLESGHALVADFGIARVGQPATQRLTDAGLIIGTPSYMSPEQAAGASDLDGRSDTYALGCVLYEMLAGRAPFVGRTAESILRQHLTVEAPSIDAIRPSIPEWGTAALSRALAKTPADRFAHISQFAEALDSKLMVKKTVGGLRTSRRSRTALIVLAVGVVLTAVLLPGSPESGTSIRSLVVLPLENLSRNPEKEYLVEGIHDALIGELGQIAALRVMSYTTARHYKGTGKTIDEIARELDVDGVIEGTVLLMGDSVHLQVRLIGARPERPIWAAKYEKGIRNALGVGEVIRAIANQIEVELTPQEIAQLAPEKPVITEAQDNYLRGLQLLYGRDPRGVIESIDHFRQAVATDREYAAAYAALAHAYYLTVVFWYAPADSGYTWAARALDMAEKAIELDPGNARAFMARGGIAHWSGAPADRVEPDLVQALQLRPNLAEAHTTYGTYLASQGRTQEAYEEIDRAIELDPVAPGPRTAQVNTARLADDWEKVLQTARQLRTLHPASEFAWTFEALALLVLGRPADCLGLENLNDGMKAVCLHAAGRATEAESRIRLAAAAWERADRTGWPLYLVWYYARASQLMDAITWTERAFQRTPAGYGGPGFPMGELEGVLDLEGGRFRTVVSRLRRQAWERVLREKRRIAVPGPGK